MSSISLSGTPDYGSLQAWEDDAPATLTAIWLGEIQEPDDNFTAVLTVSGSTATSSFYKRLTTASGASFKDHANAATNPLVFDSTKGCSINVTSSFTQCINASENFFRVENLQLRTTSASSKPFFTGNASVRVSNCIMEGANAATIADFAASNHISSSVFIQKSSAAAAIVKNFGSSEFYNCTMVVPSDVTAATSGLDESFSNATVKNCAFFGVGVLSDATGATFTTCGSDSTTAKTGVTTSLTYADQFESTTSDFRLKSGADLIDGGTYDATNAPSDIIGTNFGSGTTDIGCWEFVGGGGGGSTPKGVFNHVFTGPFGGAIS